MDWLLVAAVIGLSTAVVALVCTVVALVKRNARERDQAQRGQQERLDAPHTDVTSAKDARRLPSRSPSELPIGFRSPRRVFAEAFFRGDAPSAIDVLPDLEQALGSQSTEYLLAVSSLAAAGEQVDLQPLLDAINSDVISDESVLTRIIIGVVQHYVSTDREQEGLDRIKEFLERNAYDAARPAHLRAAIANQLQMLYFGAGDTNAALKFITLAIELSPDESHHYYNLSLIHEKSLDLPQAITAIERCMELGKEAPDDRDHLVQAWDLYRQNDDREKMEKIQNRLNENTRQLLPRV